MKHTKQRLKRVLGELDGLAERFEEVGLDDLADKMDAAGGHVDEVLDTLLALG